MSDESSNNKRIAKNTLLLYFRMLLIMAVSLYTSRINLNALGVEDYGIYNVIGGVVALSGLATAALSSSISRYITFELGKSEKDRLERIFSTSVFIQIAIAIIVFILLETVGYWFVNYRLVIPSDRIYAANWVLLFSSFSCCVNLVSVPYNAAIIAHEKMSAFAYISVLEVLGKLVVAMSVLYSPSDKLILFSGLIVLISLLIRLIYSSYCKKHFAECRTSLVFDRTLIKEMFGFAGWNFIGSMGAILRDQGGNVVINLFFGPTINAARGISAQVNSAVVGFVNNFMMAMNPQITKLYASGDHDSMLKLVQQGSRLSYYILLLIALPVIINIEYILKIWLGVVPEHTSNFVRLVLVFAMSESISSPIITAMLATGSIKKFQLTAGFLQLLNLPLSYMLFYMNAPAETILIVSIVISQVSFAVRLYMLSTKVHFSLVEFYRKVYFNIILVSLVAVLTPILLLTITESSFLSFIVICVITFMSSLVSIYYIGCNSGERTLIKNKIVQILYKIKK